MRLAIKLGVRKWIRGTCETAVCQWSFQKIRGDGWRAMEKQKKGKGLEIT
jgi:hypothetical protein